MLRDRPPDPRRLVRIAKEIRAQTADYRSNEAQPFARIRELMAQRGYSPSTSWLVELHPEGTDVLMGIVVTSTSRVFLFILDFFDFPIERAEFTEWTDLTGLSTHFEYRAFAEEIEVGLGLAHSVPKES